MTRIACLSLLALTPVLAFGDEETEVADPALQSASVEQLCISREDPAALAELERREIFSSRELNAIEKQQVRTGMSKEALLCSMGPPRLIIAARSEYEAFPSIVDAYVYDSGTERPLAAFVEHFEGQGTVVLVLEKDDPQDLARLVVSTTFRCYQPPRNGTICHEVRSADERPDPGLTLGGRGGVSIGGD